MTNKELQILMQRAKIEAEMINKKRLNEIRKEAYKVNKVVEWDKCKGMDFDTFCDVFMHYNVTDAFKIFYSFYQHIDLLNHIIFKERE